LSIDAETGTSFWTDAIMKEMSKVKIAFEFCEDWTPDQVQQGLARRDFVGFQEMDLTRKAQFVAGGHMTETPASLTYSSVVSRDRVRISFLIAALNDLEILSCDISNAYLNAPCREKIWFVAGSCSTQSWAFGDCLSFLCLSAETQQIEHYFRSD
jgi:hypothetical protein